MIDLSGLLYRTGVNRIIAPLIFDLQALLRSTDLDIVVSMVDDLTESGLTWAIENQRSNGSTRDEAYLKKQTLDFYDAHELLQLALNQMTPKEMGDIGLAWIDENSKTHEGIYEYELHAIMSLQIIWLFLSKDEKDPILLFLASERLRYAEKRCTTKTYHSVLFGRKAGADKRAAKYRPFKRFVYNEYMKTRPWSKASAAANHITLLLEEKIGTDPDLPTGVMKINVWSRVEEWCRQIKKDPENFL